MNTYLFNAISFDGARPTPALLLSHEFTAALITTANTDPCGIDPDQKTLINTGNVDPSDIEPEQTTLINTGNTDPFGVDPVQTTLITVGLTPED